MLGPAFDGGASSLGSPAPPCQSSGDVGASPSKPRATKRRLIRIFGNIMPLPQRQSAATRAFLQRPRARPDRMLLAPQASGASPPRPTPGAKVNTPQTNRAARPGAKMTQTRPQNARMAESTDRPGRAKKTNADARSAELGGGRPPTAPPPKKNSASAVYSAVAPSSSVDPGAPCLWANSAKAFKVWALT